MQLVVIPIGIATPCTQTYNAITSIDVRATGPGQLQPTKNNILNLPYRNGFGTPAATSSCSTTTQSIPTWT